MKKFSNDPDGITKVDLSKPKTETDAVQERETEKVDVGEQTGDGEKVGEGEEPEQKDTTEKFLEQQGKSREELEKQRDAQIKDMTALLEYYKLHPNETSKSELRKLRKQLTELEENVDCLFFLGTITGEKL